MKLIQSLIVAAVVATPAVSSFAQSNQPLSRTQVRAELVQLEQTGYQPGVGDRTTYPVQIQAAEARIAAQSAAQSAIQNNASGDYGGVADGSSASGVSFRAAATTRSIYFGH
jgi:hypothetical protein